MSIGDGVSIGNAVNLENVRVEHGELVIGRITLARDACIGSYAVIEGNTRIGEAGHLEGQSALGDGVSIPDGRIWTGSSPPVRRSPCRSPGRWMRWKPGAMRPPHGTTTASAKNTGC